MAKTSYQSTDFSWNAFMSLGFRPFYLAGSSYAVISMLLWVAYLFDAIELQGPLDGVLWHSHELIFGFATAILIGFLFTAVRNWTKLPTPSGSLLLALLALWCVGRTTPFLGLGAIGVGLDLAFLPVAAICIAIPIFKSQNRRNYFAVALLVVLSSAHFVFYAVAYELMEVDDSLVFLTAVNVFAIFITVIAGRIIPLFSNNAYGEKRAKRHRGLEYVIVFGMLAVLGTDAVFGISDELAPQRAAFMTLLAMFHVIKMLCWRPHITLSDPILWILPLSYAWVPIALTLRAASLLDWPVDQILGLHAMTAGAMGSMMLAMMTRSSLGHTGRPIKASKLDTAIFISISLGAAVRVFGPIVMPELYLMEIALSSVLWSIAFLIFTLRYWPILTSERI
ncbi:NnrS family protein [Cohaesibacter celericrescens]|nr:NnrS family protein [Cohaesibacter celericrescens]